MTLSVLFASLKLIHMSGIILADVYGAAAATTSRYFFLTNPLF